MNLTNILIWPVAVRARERKDSVPHRSGLAAAAGLLPTYELMQTIFRTHHTNNFTNLPNSLLRDKTLSFKARGVLAMILSNSGQWVVTSRWIEDSGTEGREAIKSALDELREARYAFHHMEKEASGKWAFSCWQFHDTPQSEPHNGKPYDGKPRDGLPYTSEGLLTEVLSKEKKGNKASLKKFMKPSFDEMEIYAAKIGMLPTEINKFFDYHESKGWVVGRAPMRNWQAAMRTWNANARQWATIKPKPMTLQERLDRGNDIRLRRSCPEEYAEQVALGNKPDV